MRTARISVWIATFGVCLAFRVDAACFAYREPGTREFQIDCYPDAAACSTAIVAYQKNNRSIATLGCAPHIYCVTYNAGEARDCYVDGSECEKRRSALTAARASKVGTCVATPPLPPYKEPAPRPVCYTAVLKDRALEACFGAIGQACKSQTVPDHSIPPKNLVDLGVPVAQLEQNCSISEAVSVGSIMHDNCCMSFPDGIYCKADPLDFGAEIQGALTSLNCHREWRKAVYDVLEHRYWFEKFGPYLADVYGALQKGDSGVDTTVTARKGFTYGPNGVQDRPYRWAGPERAATARLKAPSGTKLEIGDVAFCASGQFREEEWCMKVPPTCSGTAKLNGMTFVTWKLNKMKECNGYWATDPRKIGCLANVTAEETTYKNRASHWGICQ